MLMPDNPKYSKAVEWNINNQVFIYLNHRKLISKLRLISEAAKLEDEVCVDTNCIDWDEAARGWQSVKPYSKYTKPINLKNTKKDFSFIISNRHCSLQFKCLKDQEITNSTSNSSMPLVNTKNDLQSQYYTGSYEKSIDRLKYLADFYSMEVSATKKMLSKRTGRSLKELKPHLSKISSEIPNHQFKDKKRRYEFKLSAPKIMKKLTNNKNDRKKLQDTISLNKKSLNQISIPNHDLFPTFEDPPKAETFKNKALLKKPLTLLNSSFPNKKTVLRSQEFKADIVLHVVLPSIAHTTKIDQLCIDTYMEKLNLGEEKTNLKEENSLSLLETYEKKSSDISSEGNLSLTRNKSNRFSWKYIPFIPSVLQPDVPANQKLNKKRPLPYVDAITKGTAKAGVTSNSINKLQRTTLHSLETLLMISHSC